METVYGAGSKFGAARSSLPSPLKSAEITDSVRPGMGRSVWGPKVPSPLPRKMDIEREKPFATARSGLPSPLKSPVDTQTVDVEPVVKLVLKVNVPSPLPKRI